MGGWWDSECREEKRKVRRGWGRYRARKKEYEKMCEEKKKKETERWEKRSGGGENGGAGLEGGEQRKEDEKEGKRGDRNKGVE